MKIKKLLTIKVISLSVLVISLIPIDYGFSLTSNCNLRVPLNTTKQRQQETQLELLSEKARGSILSISAKLGFPVINLKEHKIGNRFLWTEKGIYYAMKSLAKKISTSANRFNIAFNEDSFLGAIRRKGIFGGLVDDIRQFGMRGNKFTTDFSYSDRKKNYAMRIRIYFSPTDDSLSAGVVVGDNTPSKDFYGTFFNGKIYSEKTYKVKMYGTYDEWKKNKIKLSKWLTAENKDSYYIIREDLPQIFQRINQRQGNNL